MATSTAAAGIETRPPQSPSAGAPHPRRCSGSRATSWGFKGGSAFLTRPRQRTERRRPARVRGPRHRTRRSALQGPSSCLSRSAPRARCSSTPIRATRPPRGSAPGAAPTGKSGKRSGTGAGTSVLAHGQENGASRLGDGGGRSRIGGFAAPITALRLAFPQGSMVRERP